MIGVPYFIVINFMCNTFMQDLEGSGKRADLTGAGVQGPQVRTEPLAVNS